ncbi:hypothetical protein Tco_1253892 [Tanacetum coccineum]
MMRPDHHDPNAQDKKPWKRYCFHKFTMSFCYGKDVPEMLSLVCADDELQSKKIIKFRLGGRAHSLTLLVFARRLGLHQAVELEEDGFNVYFEGGLRSDENFNATDYWTIGYDKVQKNDLWLLSMFDARNQNGYANVSWVIAKWMKKKGVGTQKESQICYGQFISKFARKCRVLTEDVVRSLSAPIYCRDLDTTTLRYLIDSDGKLIPEDLQPGVPRVGIPRPSRASMQDLYDRMGHMEIPYDGEINLAFNENLISNKYAVKLCLDYEVKKGNKVVKKELIVALKRELYFVKFIINPKEDDVELGVIFGRTFMRLVNGIVDFGSGVIIVYPEEDLFKDDSTKTEKSMDD